MVWALPANAALDHRAAIEASPSYFESHPKPKTPHDLLAHRRINFRHGATGVYRWEFDKGKKSLSVAVNGPLIVDDVRPWFAPRLMASALLSCQMSA